MARKKKNTKHPIESYEHRDKARLNNPPVGLVTPQTDPDASGCPGKLFLALLPTTSLALLGALGLGIVGLGIQSSHLIARTWHAAYPNSWQVRLKQPTLYSQDHATAAKARL